MRVAFADRDTAQSAAGVSDPRLARLVAAAAYEWSHPRAALKPMRVWFGRPYPIVLLVFVLCTELGVEVLRITRVLEGRYSWLPLLPTPAAEVLFAAYLVLVIATIVLLWRQSSIGYRLAWLLSAVQFVRPLALYLPLTHSYGLGTVEFWVVWSWSYPAMIWLMFALLYMERLRRARSLDGWRE